MSEEISSILVNTTMDCKFVPIEGYGVKQGVHHPWYRHFDSDDVAEHQRSRQAKETNKSQSIYVSRHIDIYGGAENPWRACAMRGHVPTTISTDTHPVPGAYCTIDFNDLPVVRALNLRRTPNPNTQMPINSDMNYDDLTLDIVENSVLKKGHPIPQEIIDHFRFQEENFPPLCNTNEC